MVLDTVAHTAVALTEEDQIEAGGIVVAYLDEYNATGSEPNADAYIAQASNDAVERAVRLHIDTARRLLGLA